MDSQLLVAGVLCVFVCLFQIVSIVASRSLYRAMVKQEGEGDSWLGSGEGGHLTIQRLRERDAVLNGLATNNFSKQNVLGKLNFQNKRDTTEKYVILWALVMALFQIYFYGTYVVFSSSLKYDKGANNDFWMNSAWYKLGNADTRCVCVCAYNHSYCIYPLHYTALCNHFMSVFFPPYSSTILCLLLSVLLFIDLHTYLNSSPAIVPMLLFSCLINGIFNHLKRIIVGYIYFSIPVFYSLYHRSLTLPCLSLSSLNPFRLSDM